MRISGFYIDGFGIFHNQSVQDIPDGLILFTGKNEGGKTTLMEFIRAILFGFPKKRRNMEVNSYQPYIGGNHGGRLRVAMQDDQVFTVERLVGKRPMIIKDDNTSEQAEPSDHFLRGLDRQTFEQIFAIGLEDMKGLEVLSEEGVHRRLMAASTGVGASSVPSIMDQIDSEIDELLKSSQSKNPKINALAKKLDEIGSNIKKLHGQSAEYAELQFNLTELNGQIEQNELELKSVRQRLYRIEALEKARNPWVELCKARKKVKELEKAQHFPPSGLDRLEKLKNEIDEKSQKEEILKTKIRNLDKQSNKLFEDQVVRSNIINNQTTIITLVKEQEKLKSELNKLPTAKIDFEREERNFERKLIDLGADWTPERLDEIDTSVQIRQWVQEIDRKLDAAERYYERIKADEEIAKKNERSANEIAKEVKKDFDKLIKPVIDNMEVLRKKREAVREMRSWFYKNDNIGTHLNYRKSRLDEEKSHLAAQAKKVGKLTNPLPSWMPLLAFIIGLALTAIFAILSTYTLTSVTFLIGLGTMFLLRSFRKNQLAQKEEKQQIEQVIEKLNKEIGDFETQRLMIIDEVKKIAQEVGFDKIENSDELDQTEAGLDDANEELQNWMMQNQKADEATELWNKAKNQLGEAEKASEKAYGKLKELEDRWQEWIFKCGFVETIKPGGFEVILHMVENARESKDKLEKSRQSIILMETYISEIRNRIKKALEICSLETLITDVGVSELDSIEKALDNALKVENLQKEFERLKVDINGIKADLIDLLQKAGASDEEGFRHKAKDYEEWSDNTKQIEVSNLTLLAIAGNIEAQENLENELAETEPYKLKIEKDELQNRLTILESKIKESDQKIGEINKTLNDLAHDEQLSKLLLEQNRLKEEFSDAVKRWATLTITRHLLDQARGIYERERQPKVIQEATRFVEVMTHRPYRMVMPAGDSNIQLEDKITLNRKSEIGWSSGLADQVYLAIRFGLAQDFARHEEPLPIILDDVLVRFDPERQLGAVRVILDLSRHHQILMFTCDPDIRGITEKALENSNLENNVNITYYTINNGTIIKE